MLKRKVPFQMEINLLLENSNLGIMIGGIIKKNIHSATQTLHP